LAGSPFGQISESDIISAYVSHSPFQDLNRNQNGLSKNHHRADVFRQTEELIRILHRSQIAGKTVLVIKPRLDTRTKNEIASRKKPNAEATVFQKFMDFPAFPISSAQELKNLLEEHQPDVLGLMKPSF